MNDLLCPINNCLLTLELGCPPQTNALPLKNNPSMLLPRGYVAIVLEQMDCSGYLKSTISTSLFAPIPPITIRVSISLNGAIGVVDIVGVVWVVTVVVDCVGTGVSGSSKQEQVTKIVKTTLQ